MKKLRSFAAALLSLVMALSMLSFAAAGAQDGAIPAGEPSETVTVEELAEEVENTADAAKELTEDAEEPAAVPAAAALAAPAGPLQFTIRNENYAFTEGIAAAVIDCGGVIDGSALTKEDFTATYANVRISTGAADTTSRGTRVIWNVWVNDTGVWTDKSDDNQGRYIVLEFKNWGAGSADPGNATTVPSSNYSVRPVYTITYSGAGINYADGSVASSPAFQQAGVVSPVVDLFTYATIGTGNSQTRYQYYLNNEAEGPLPVVVFFHGASQGTDGYTHLRSPNAGSVWAQPENQAKHPCHVLVPAGSSGMSPWNNTHFDNVKRIIDQWIDEGKADPNRIYITGLSMGGGATWNFLQRFPNYVAAAVPVCAASGLSNATNARLFAELPIWAFVTIRDPQCWGTVASNHNSYGQYLNNYRLTVFQHNGLDAYPYNVDWGYSQASNNTQDEKDFFKYGSWNFGAHCAWIRAFNNYNDTLDIGPYASSHVAGTKSITTNNGNFNFTTGGSDLSARGDLYDWLFAQSKAPADFPFEIRNENFAFSEGIAAAVIDCGSKVDLSGLTKADFTATYSNVRLSNGAVDTTSVGTRVIWNVYANDTGVWTDKSENNQGRYIVLEFKNWGAGSADPGNATTVPSSNYSVKPVYTITLNQGSTLKFVNGVQASAPAFHQEAVVSPVVDLFTRDTEVTGNTSTVYQYYLNEDAEGPLPVVVFLHGGGQGTDGYTHLRSPNGGSVWAQPENQAKNPCHVLVPAANSWSNAHFDNVKKIIDRWIAEGKADPERIYITGLSMGGGGTWNFLQRYPDYFAAAVPICVASGLTSVTNARKFSNMPIWAFVTINDPVCWGTTVNNHNNYGQYLENYRLTIFRHNGLDAYPYNVDWGYDLSGSGTQDEKDFATYGSWNFGAHCAWIRAYNNYDDTLDIGPYASVHYAGDLRVVGTGAGFSFDAPDSGLEPRGSMYDWLFAQHRRYTYDLRELISAVERDIEAGIYNGKAKAGVDALKGTLANAKAVVADESNYQRDINDAYDALQAARDIPEDGEFTCTIKSMLAKVAKLQKIPYTWSGYGDVAGVITFSSSNTAVCNVTADGTLVPMKAGIAVITIAVPNKANIIFAVTVSA